MRVSSPTDEANTIFDLARFIRDRTDEVLLYPNRGNAGDSLIAAGTYAFFEKSGISFRFVRDGERFGKDDVLWYSGGGNFVTYYTGCARWLREHAPKSRCIVLPHTINDTRTLSNLSENTSLICREAESYDLCRKHGRCEVFLHRDMAFYLEPGFLGITPKPGFGNLLAFRTDSEKTISPPRHSLDVSRLYNCDRFSKESVYDCARCFLGTINDFETIYTNRLHVAMAGYLLKKKTFLFPNSYYKNRAVFEQGLKGSTVEFLENIGELPDASFLRTCRYMLLGKMQRMRTRLLKFFR